MRCMLLGGCDHTDYTAFIDHLGIPSLDMAFWPDAAYGVYHSTFDSFEWMDCETDDGVNRLPDIVA